MSARNDGEAKWTHPEWPVMCALSSDGVPCPILDKPAGVTQILRSTKMLAVASGLKGRVYAHALRSGYARDVSGLDSMIKGTTHGAVAEALGHKFTTTTRDGLTCRSFGKPRSTRPTAANKVCVRGRLAGTADPREKHTFDCDVFRHLTPRATKSGC